MRRRRHSLQVSTFPFLAVLLCAMGSLILLLLVMDKRAKAVARAKAEASSAEAAEKAAREREAIAAARQAEWERKKQQVRAAWEKKRDELHARLSAEELQVQREMQAVRDQLAAAAARLRAEEYAAGELKNHLDGERQHLAAEQKMLASKKKEMNQAAPQGDASAALAKMNAELTLAEQALADLRAARRRAAQTYSVIPYRGKRGDNRPPLYVECAASGLIFHPERVLLPLSAAQAEVRAEVERRAARQKQELSARGLPVDKPPYLLVLVRPDGIPSYYLLQAALAGREVDFGYEFIDSDWALEFPTDDDKPANQSWIAGSNSVPVPGTGPSGPRIAVSAVPAGQGHGRVTRPEGAGTTAASGGSAANASDSPSGKKGPISPLSPWGRGVGGEGAKFSAVSSPSPPTPLPQGDRGERKPVTSTGNANEMGGGTAAEVSLLPPRGKVGPGGLGNGVGPSVMGFRGTPGGKDYPNGVPTGARTTSGTSLPGGERPAPSPGKNREANEALFPGGNFGPSGAGGGGSSGLASTGSPTQSPSPHTVTDKPSAPGGNRNPAPEKPLTPSATSRQGPGPKDGIPAPPGTPIASSQPGGSPPRSGEKGAGPPADPLARFAPETPKQARRPVPLRPARLNGDRDWIIFVECRAEEVVLYPARQEFPLRTLILGAEGNPLRKAIQTMIERRQASVRPGELPYRPQVRFLVGPDALRTFHLAYPALEGLAVPKTRQNLQPEDDVLAIVAGG